jgi:hypothetical protein
MSPPYHLVITDTARKARFFFCFIYVAMPALSEREIVGLFLTTWSEKGLGVDNYTARAARSTLQNQITAIQGSAQKLSVLGPSLNQLRFP